MKNNFEKHTVIVLKKMCKIVGAKYDDIDFKSAFWFNKHSWSISQEDTFKKWLVKYLQESKEARNEIMAYPELKSKENILKVTSFFILMYGWRHDTV